MTTPSCGQPCKPHGGPCVAGFMDAERKEMLRKVFGQISIGADEPHTHRCVKCIQEAQRS